MTQAYADFLAAKALAAPAQGFTVDPATLPAALHPWQRDIVVWALARGRAALFAECGLGKTLMELAWGQAIAAATELPVLILTPLAVAEQTVAEGAKFGVPVTLCERESDVQPGVNVTNYEKLHLFPTVQLGGVILDESSILKSYVGKTKQALVARFAATRYKLCATATPAPNDHTELGNHSEFLGIMTSGEMLTRWFITDTQHAQNLRLKGHAAADFWRWVATWAVALTTPSDLRDPATGQPYSDEGYNLPALSIVPYTVEVDISLEAGPYLFRLPARSATEQHREARLTVAQRAAQTAALVQAAPGPWIVWCHTNAEADHVKALLPTAVEVRGSDSAAHKTATLRAFTDGQLPILITKPSIAGFGLNWQHCHQMVFVGLSYSFEQFYQALRRCWRFGQTAPVTAHLIGADTEDAIQQALLRKQAEHAVMQHALVAVLTERGLSLEEGPRITLTAPVREVVADPDYTLVLGDCVEAIADVPSDSVGLSVFSPPFSDLYMYTPDPRDMGNCNGDDHFFQHFAYLVPELWRVTMPGRLCVVHCKDLSRYKSKTGATGLRDFPGDLIRAFCGDEQWQLLTARATLVRLGLDTSALDSALAQVQAAPGQWIYHSRFTIWRDPVQERARTNAQRLLYKQLQGDASKSGSGLPDYLVVFRKWVPGDVSAAKVTHTKEGFPLEQWQEWASPVWWDINPMDVLNELMAKENTDEKHICPLQLGLIARCIELWTNRGDIVFDPFSGFSSAGYEALKLERRYYGIELKESYFRAARKFLTLAKLERTQVPIGALRDWDLAGVSA